MTIRTYLPSAQLSLLVISITITSGLIVAANYSTKPYRVTDVSITQTQTPSYDWRTTLNTVQTESGIAAPAPADKATVSALQDAAQKTTNVTDAVSRTLFVDLTSAKIQGLGGDIPTQNQVITNAISKIDSKKPSILYTQNDLVLVANTPEAQKTYGNELATVVAKNSNTSYVDTMVAIDNATSQNESSHLQTLPSIAVSYQIVAKALLRIPVPQTFAPFHLQLVNNFQKIAEVYTPMGTILTDPLQGLTAIKDYQALTKETILVFINIGQILNKNGILFTKDEPGSAWGVLVSTQ